MQARPWQNDKLLKLFETPTVDETDKAAKTPIVDEVDKIGKVDELTDMCIIVDAIGIEPTWPKLNQVVSFKQIAYKLKEQCNVVGL